MKYKLKPYMSDEEVAYFEDLFSKLPEEAVVVEWGSGGSTTMFLQLMGPKQRLISVEHDPDWAVKVNQAVEDFPNKHNFLSVNINLQTIELTADDGRTDSEFYENYKKLMMGMFLEENPCFLDHYIDPTKLLPKLDETMSKKLGVFHDADVFLVDGLARGAILATLKIKAKKDAMIFLHDYVGRQNQYGWAASLFSKEEVVVGSLLKLTI